MGFDDYDNYRYAPPQSGGACGVSGSSGSSGSLDYIFDIIVRLDRRNPYHEEVLRLVKGLPSIERKNFIISAILYYAKSPSYLLNSKFDKVDRLVDALEYALDSGGGLSVPNRRGGLPFLSGGSLERVSEQDPAYDGRGGLLARASMVGSEKPETLDNTEICGSMGSGDISFSELAKQFE